MDITFSPFQCTIDMGFWQELSKKKIEEWKLDQSPKVLQGYAKCNNIKDKYSYIAFDIYSFNEFKEKHQSTLYIRAETQLQNYNTIEQFKKIDIQETKKDSLCELEKNFEKSIQQKDNRVLLTCSKVLSFADLKKYLFYYYYIQPYFEVTVKVDVIKEIDQEIQNLEQFGEDFQQFINQNFQSQVYCYNKGQFKGIFEYEDGDYVVFIDRFSKKDQFSSSLSNLFVLLNKMKVQTGRILVLKEQFFYNYSKKIEFKNSVYLQVDLSKVQVQNLNQTVEKLVQIDLKSQLDEKQIAAQANSLNIKLMKWRMLPSLNMDLLANAKVLLIGAGTLGCQLSRNLIGWGIKKIDFLDNGKVSYSNPCRQSLYTYEDSINGGKNKAQCAAQKLKEISPDIESTGFNIQVPMPGHFVSNEEEFNKILQKTEELDLLIQQYTVIYLLTDSRESRWLPTVLANKHNIICICVGLGFDSYVVIRHGISSSVFDKEKHKERMGCYFCNDIVTPGNSIKDRTLDQQCTVTRPGLSFISAAYASELLISLLHHPLQQGAPSDESVEKMEQTDLGILPQHIRGNLSDFNTSLYYGHSFDKCIACSSFVLDYYTKNRQEFMMKVINEPDYLQEITGIKKEIDAMNLENNIIELSDDDF